MFRNRPEEKQARYIYTWNPNWEEFQHLPLRKKILAFNEFVLKCQFHFQEQAISDRNAVCLIVAPDLVFSGKWPTTYSHDDNEKLKVSHSFLQGLLDERVLVIAGSIRYLTSTNNQYKISAYYISAKLIQAYDKQIPSGQLIISDKNIPLTCKKRTGIYEFNGIRVGLEICKDHDDGLLNIETGKGCVDIHVLISNGQNIRHNNIAASRHDGIFVACELEPGRKVDDVKKSEETACYAVTTSEKIVDAHRAKMFATFSPNVTMHLEKQKQTVIDTKSNISVCVFNAELKHELCYKYQ